MIEAAVQLLEVQAVGGGLVSGRIACPPRLAFKPGQYLLASAPGLSEVLPTVLFPAQIEADTLLLAPPLPPTWLPGVALKLRGPLGHNPCRLFRAVTPMSRVNPLGEGGALPCHATHCLPYRGVCGAGLHSINAWSTRDSPGSPYRSARVERA